MMNHEYIVPMTEETREITLYPDGGNGVPSSNRSTSLKPQLHFSSPCFVRNYEIEGDCAVEIGCTASPEFPLDILKNLTVDMLTAGVCAVRQDVRDPEGGNVELLLVPLFRLFYTLLVMGVFRDGDIGKVLRLIEPGVFLTNPESSVVEEEEDYRDDEKEWKDGHQKKEETSQQGLLQMKLPEAVKLEVDKAEFYFVIILLFLYDPFKKMYKRNFKHFPSPALPALVLPV